MISGKHIQPSTRRRLSYMALHERIGSRLYITASVRYGERLLASPDLEASYRADMGPEEDAVVAAVVRYLNETTFDLGEPEPSSLPKPMPQREAAGPQAPSARSAWAQLRANDFGSF